MEELRVSRIDAEAGGHRDIVDVAEDPKRGSRQHDDAGRRTCGSPQPAAPLPEQPLAGRLGHHIARRHLGKQDVPVISAEDEVAEAQLDELVRRLAEPREDVAHDPPRGQPTRPAFAEGVDLLGSDDHQIAPGKAGLQSANWRLDEIVEHDVGITLARAARSATQPDPPHRPTAALR